MPFSPTLPRADVDDLCAGTAMESGTELTRPKLFETLCGSLAIYGAYWHLPQKMILAPDGDLILSNIYRGTLWRLHTDGSLPAEGWTSVYHRGRNEPFESHDWTQDFLNVQDLRNYLPFHSLHYPYFCFGPQQELYLSAGQSSRLTRQVWLSLGSRPTGSAIPDRTVHSSTRIIRLEVPPGCWHSIRDRRCAGGLCGPGWSGARRFAPDCSRCRTQSTSGHRSGQASLRHDHPLRTRREPSPTS